MADGTTLNIGVNHFDPTHYGNDGALKGCENDARSMHQLATDMGFAGSQLLSEEATRDNVILAINQAAATLKTGDIFFISYSGHGGSIPDSSKDESDQTDETWCLFDAQLIDDELRFLWSRFKPGVRILVISDSCHSGTVTKDTSQDSPTHYSDQAARFLPFKQAEKIWAESKAFYRNLNAPRRSVSVSARVRLLSGCQDNQYSYDGEKNGAFTSQLLKTWNEGRFTGNYTQFHQQILMKMPAYQSPNHFIYGGANQAFDLNRPFEI